jgi:ketosteroid isomerase-like protein
VEGNVRPVSSRSPIAVIAALALAAVAAPASAQASSRAPASDSAAAAAVVERFHRALADADSALALALLSDDVVIIESGDVESRAEYRAHHLPADIAFARDVRSERSPVRVALRGDVAWATATSTTRGRFHDRDVGSAGAELMVLTRAPDGWRISAIHWSSHKRSS